MLVRGTLVGKELTSRLLRQTRWRSRLAVEPETTGRRSDLRLPGHKTKQPTREPFAKNLLIGKFDVEFLVYPEAQTHDRHREFFEWLKRIEDYINESVDVREIDANSQVKKEIFEELGKLGVLRAAVDEAYGGLGLNNSEYAKLVETVSSVPVLGTYLIKRASVVNMISKFGTEEQKSYLLPKIANGEITPTLCFSENPTGSTTDPLNAKAIISNCRTFYTINARKTCVFDATNADMFLIMAQNARPDDYSKSETLTAFLVPRSTKGVDVGKPDPMLGQRGIDICTVNFDKVEIPLRGQLGTGVVETDLFVSALGEGKHYVGAQAIGVSKRFFNLLLTNVTESKNFNSKRKIEDSVHEIIGKIASSLYAMEAMIYMTTGMMDNFENQDASVEKSLIECYCTNACNELILRGMALLGTGGYLRSEPFERIVRDSLTLRTYDRRAVDTKIFAALLGIRHAGIAIGENVKQSRNPFMYPLEMLRSISDRDKKLYLDENLHPSLRLSGKSLEHSVNQLKKVVESLFIRNGILVMNQRMELRRLTEIMIEIYAMTAVVARASRSYCIGMRNSDHEIKVAMIFTYHTYERVNTIVRELMEGDWINGDVMLKDIANAIFDNKKYFASHPLERNF